MSDSALSQSRPEPGRIALAQRGRDQAGWRRWLPGLQTLAPLPVSLAAPRHCGRAGANDDAGARRYRLCGGIGRAGHSRPLRDDRSALAYALFGPSRILVLGPDSSLAAVILAVVLPLSGGDPARAVALAGMMAVVSGIVCILAGLARVGFITELLSKPIRYGYMNGIALTVLISQLPKLGGFSIESDGPLRNLLAIATAVFDGERTGPRSWLAQVPWP